MILEYDGDADALYVRVREAPGGRVARTVELAEGVYADLDADDRPLGVEFMALAAFGGWLRRHGTLAIPERVEGPESFIRPPKASA